MMHKSHWFEFRFPQHWQYLASKGVNRFVTQVVHQLPDGSRIIWSSRRFRKRNSSERLPRSFHLSSKNKHRYLSRFHVWGWKLQQISWWIGFIFTLGSILFVVGAVRTMLPTPPMAFIAQLNFTGSVCFTVGSYLAVFEVLNLTVEITHSESLKNGQDSTNPLVLHTRTTSKKVKWWGWLPHRLDYRSALTQLIGACCFNINCFFALFNKLTWQQIDLLIWFPSTVASVCFCLASYLAVTEVCHQHWAWMPQKIEWWVVLLNLLGSFGFLSGSCFGFLGQGPAQCCQQWGTNLSFLLGSIYFLGGSYLMVPEMLQDHQ